MNENLNLVEILKDCPKGTKLYSPIYGDVEFVCVRQNEGVEYPIQTKISDYALDGFTKDGRLFAEYKGECMLFPSREVRDWSNFKPKQPKQPKFDPNTLKPFDKVLARNGVEDYWECTLFSYLVNTVDDSNYYCLGIRYKYCIPYNDDTKHLIGTDDGAPEFYRHSEDEL